MHDLEVLIESGRRLIVLETEREGCFVDGFRRLSKRSTKAYFQWTVTQGLLRLAPDYAPQSMNKDINQLFAQIQSTDISGVYVLVDFHHYLQDPTVIRHVKDVLQQCPQHTLVLLSQVVELPEDLASLATHFELPLPTTSDLNRMVNDLALEYLGEQGAKLQVPEKDMIKQLVKSLCGLSYNDAHRMVKHAIWNDGIINLQDITGVVEQKFALLNKDNVLNLELDYAELDEIAGFSKLKQWLALRRQFFLGDIDLPGGDKPKGLLLLGVQGCGKSMAAKAVAGSWKLPLLHLDFGTLYNRFYGQTEENLRSALHAAEKMQPCVLWLDEVEKGMSAVSSSDDVSKRMLGTFLTWLAEKKESVFVVATANDVTALPPELMRKGRFDEVFFVDLPNQSEREAILKIHLKRRKLSAQELDVSMLAELAEGFSGAEIEQLVVSALYHSYADHSDDKARSLVDNNLIVSLINDTQPLSVLMTEKINALRSWAQGRTTGVS